MQNPAAAILARPVLELPCGRLVRTVAIGAHSFCCLRATAPRRVARPRLAAEGCRTARERPEAGHTGIPVEFEITEGRGLKVHFGHARRMAQQLRARRRNG